MSKGILAAGVIMLGILTLALVNIIQSYSSGNELDYALLKDTTEAAMFDAVDIGYYQTSGGQIRMDKEKFVESFVRRFAQNVNQDRDYNIRFFDINETPPKVSVRIGSTTAATFDSESWGIKNQIDAILETKYQEKRTVDEAIKKLYQNAGGYQGNTSSDGEDSDLPTPAVLLAYIQSDWKSYYTCKTDSTDSSYENCKLISLENIVRTVTANYEKSYSKKLNSDEKAYFEAATGVLYPSLEREKRVKK